MTKPIKPESTAYINRFLEETIIGKAAKQVATKMEFPEETATLIALSMASFSAGIGYRVLYEDGEPLPIPLYALAEQPSGVGKSGIFNKLGKGLRSAIEIENARRVAVRSEILKSQEENGGLNDYEEQELKDNHKILQPITNTTPEALDKALANQGGWFLVSSSEQGLLNTLVGGMYNDGKKSFDLLLKGFGAEEHNELRVTREAYDGLPHGGVCCVSQSGTLLTVLENSGSTGLVERFLMIIEKQLRGHRTFANRNSPSDQMAIFNDKCQEIANRGFSKHKSLEFHNLTDLKINKAGWDEIYKQRVLVEPLLAEDGKYNAEIFSALWSKMDIQIMKIAATVHLMSAAANDMTIKKDSVLVAICITKEILKGVVAICEKKGIVGKTTELSEAEDYMAQFSMQLKAKTERQILDALRRRKVFMQYGDQARAQAKQALNQLIESGLVEMVSNGRTKKYWYRG